MLRYKDVCELLKTAAGPNTLAATAITPVKDSQANRKEHVRQQIQQVTKERAAGTLKPYGVQSAPAYDPYSFVQRLRPKSQLDRGVTLPARKGIYTASSPEQLKRKRRIQQMSRALLYEQRPRFRLRLQMASLPSAVEQFINSPVK